jgi:hypothetical protein
MRFCRARSRRSISRSISAGASCSFIAFMCSPHRFLALTTQWRLNLKSGQLEDGWHHSLAVTTGYPVLRGLQGHFIHSVTHAPRKFHAVAGWRNVARQRRDADNFLHRSCSFPLQIGKLGAQPELSVFGAGQTPLTERRFLFGTTVETPTANIMGRRLNSHEDSAPATV